MVLSTGRQTGFPSLRRRLSRLRLGYKATICLLERGVKVTSNASLIWVGHKVRRPNGYRHIEKLTETSGAPCAAAGHSNGFGTGFGTADIAYQSLTFARRSHPHSPRATFHHLVRHGRDNRLASPLRANVVVSGHLYVRRTRWRGGGAVFRGGLARPSHVNGTIALAANYLRDIPGTAGVKD